MLNYYFKTLYPIDMKTYESEGMGYKIKSVIWWEPVKNNQLHGE